MIKAVIFDIGAVLIRFEWRDFLHRLFGAETGDAVYDATWGTEAWRQLDRDVLPQREVLQLFTDNAPEYAAEITEAMRRVHECAEKQPYAVQWVEALKQMGLQVYFLSNYFPYLIWKNPQVLDFIPHMDGGLFSWQEKITKPDPEIFRRLLQRYGLRAEECVFVDDSPVNTAAAAALGMRAFQFESYEAQYPEIMNFLSECTNS